MGEAEDIVPSGDSGLDYDPTQQEDERPRVMARDPVCGMDVDPEHAPARSIHRGVAYYFCTSACRIEFDRDPTTYVG